MLLYDKTFLLHPEVTLIKLVPQKCEQNKIIFVCTPKSDSYPTSDITDRFKFTNRFYKSHIFCHHLSAPHAYDGSFTSNVLRATDIPYVRGAGYMCKIQLFTLQCNLKRRTLTKITVSV